MNHEPNTTSRLDTNRVRRFRRRVLAWQQQHGRHDLPWQQTPSPYRVWISEIMLQQTQVVTVIPYFNAFIERFPSLEALAEAELDDVLSMWTGLGYYARARNLHRCAQLIVTAHAGRFPDEIETLMALPGIGRSTAGAILSLGFGRSAPILDGNVKRVLTRHGGIVGWSGDKAVLDRLWMLSEQLTPKRDCARYNQAMMDLGATLCTRRNPACHRCPIASDCIALASDQVEQLPTPRPKKTLPERDGILLLLRDPQGRILLERRAPSGIWGGLWSLPQHHDDAGAREWLEQTFSAALARRLDSQAQFRLQHTFTHFRLRLTVLSLTVPARECERAVGDSAAPRQWWDNAESPPGGLAAPARQILDTLSGDRL